MKLNKQYTSYILFILGALLLAIGFSSCAKSEGDRLYGRWQFRYCEYPDGGTFANDSIFYCFDRGVFELQKRSKGNGSARLHGVVYHSGRFFIDKFSHGKPVRPTRSTLPFR